MFRRIISIEIGELLLSHMQPFYLNDEGIKEDMYLHEYLSTI